MDVGNLDPHELDDYGLQPYLESFRIVCVSSDKIGGQLQWQLAAEQVTVVMLMALKENETI